MKRIKKGDFSSLAKDYAKYRPSYNRFLVDIVFGALPTRAKAADVADIGAGTGIFTKCLLEKEPASIIAVEPNDEMRNAGQSTTPDGIIWQKGSAEDTGLPENSCDLVSMASSFHWPDTGKALAEFNRILRHDGIFTALWNPRLTERSVTEAKVDQLLVEKYDLKKRVSSGRSGITNNLAEILTKSGYFSNVAYCEAVDVVHITPEHYLGAWRSVNDIRSELGEQNFAAFIQDVKEICSGLNHVEVHYLTRAWIAQK